MTASISASVVGPAETEMHGTHTDLLRHAHCSHHGREFDAAPNGNAG
jgi:hypothetical protein